MTYIEPVHPIGH